MSDGPRRRFLLAGLPAWDVRAPLHSLAHVAPIIAGAGWECRTADLNIALWDAAPQHVRDRWFDADAWMDAAAARQIFDACRPALQVALEELLDEGPWDLVGLSTKSTTRQFTRFAVELLAELAPELPVVLGGPDCFPYEHGAAYFEGTPSPPAALLQGEAEVALPALLEHFDATERLDVAAPGFLVRLPDGTLRDTGRPELPHLRRDATVADYRRFDFGRYVAPVYASTFLSRGCPSRCAFCSEAPKYRNFRVRDPDTVLAEIRQAIEGQAPHRQPPHIQFAESMLNGHRRALEALCDAILASDLRFTWLAPVGFRMPLPPELLAKMRAAGCVHLFFGFESASQDVIDLMRKEYGTERVLQTLDAVEAAGIAVDLGVTVGFPGETPADVVATAAFVLEHRSRPLVRFPYVQPIMVDGDAPMRHDPEAFGLADLHQSRWTTLDGRNTPETRMLRWVVVANAAFNRPLSREAMVGAKTLAGLALEAAPARAELAGLLRALGEEAERRAEASRLAAAAEDGRLEPDAVADALLGLLRAIDAIVGAPGAPVPPLGPHEGYFV